MPLVVASVLMDRRRWPPEMIVVSLRARIPLATSDDRRLCGLATSDVERLCGLALQPVHAACAAALLPPQPDLRIWYDQSRS